MKKTILFSLSIAGFALIIGCGSTIPAGNKGVYRGYFSGTRDTAYNDGFKWHWPWNDITNYDIRWNTNSEKLNILSFDNLHMTVEIALQMRPNPDKVYSLHADIGPNYYMRVVQQPFRAIALEVLSSYTYSDISKKTVEIQSRILVELRDALEEKYIDFDSVELRHVEYPLEVIQATNKKLATEQFAEQKQYEKTIAEEDAQIQIINARGQQEAQEIIERTLTPLYLQFQAIEVQRELARNPNTVFYFIPMGQQGLPLVLEAPQLPMKQMRSAK